MVFREDDAQSDDDADDGSSDEAIVIDAAEFGDAAGGSEEGEDMIRLGSSAAVQPNSSPVATPGVKPVSLRMHDGAEGADAPWRNASSAGGQFRSLPAWSPLLRLHEEMIDFAAFIQPTAQEEADAERGLMAVIRVLADAYPTARIEVFGSRANGLALPDSDWDIAVFGASPSTNGMYSLGRAFTRSGIASKVEVVASARVPIIKVVEASTGIGVDISFGAASAIITRSLVNVLLARWPQLRPLTLVLKYFLLQRGLNETYHGGVGSFLVTMMALHVIQMKTAEMTRAAAAGADVSSSLNLGTLLLSFFELFGMNLNYVTTGIAVRGSGVGYFSKRSRGWDLAARPYLLSLESPADATADVGKNSWNILIVRKAFAFAHTQLSRGVRAFLARPASASRVAAAAAAAAGGRPSATQQLARGQVVEVSSPPQSLLATVIRIDSLLTLRARMRKAAADAAVVPIASPEVLHIAPPSTGPMRVLPPAGSAQAPIELSASPIASAAAPVAPAAWPASLSADPKQDTAALTAAAMDTLQSSGVRLRKARLLADVLTRKERRVDDLVRSSTMGTWHV